MIKLESVIEAMRDKYGRKIINKAVILKDEHMLNLNIKGDQSSLSSEVAHASTIEQPNFKDFKNK